MVVVNIHFTRQWAFQDVDRSVEQFRLEVAHTVTFYGEPESEIHEVLCRIACADERSNDEVREWVTGGRYYLHLNSLPLSPEEGSNQADGEEPVQWLLDAASRRVRRFDFPEHIATSGATFADLKVTSEAGLIKGNPREIVVFLVHGRGGDGGFLFDWVQWLLVLGVDALVGAAIDRAIIAPGIARLKTRRERNIELAKRDELRRIAMDWASREINYPHQLRELIDTKALWSSSELSEYLAIPDVLARKLLRAVGYVCDVTNSWRPGSTAKARRRRNLWLKQEKKLI